MQQNMKKTGYYVNLEQQTTNPTWLDTKKASTTLRKLKNSPPCVLYITRKPKKYFDTSLLSLFKQKSPTIIFWCVLHFNHTYSGTESFSVPSNVEISQSLLSEIKNTNFGHCVLSELAVATEKIENFSNFFPHLRQLLQTSMFLPAESFVAYFSLSRQNRYII